MTVETPVIGYEYEHRETHAKRLLEDKLFIESFEVLKKQLVSEWMHTDPLEIDKREAIHLSIKLVDRIHAHIESVMETGQIAQSLKQHPYI